MDFALFLLANLTLFVRPEEMIPALAGIPIYNYLMMATLASVLPRVAGRFRPEQLAREPITVCVLGLIPVVALSHLSHFEVQSAKTGVVMISRAVVYYLVLVSVVRSTWRLRIFLYATALFAAIISTVALLHYYGFIDVASIRATQERISDAAGGALNATPRLCATGIFGDPNDLSMIAVAGIVVCALAIEDPRLGLFRIGWTLPLALFFATLLLTKSRGGLAAFMVGSLLLSSLRFGLWKTVGVAALMLPVVAFSLGGRRAEASAGVVPASPEGSAIEVCSDGLSEMKTAPLFGIGFNSYLDDGGIAARNSFIHTFVELGLVGGVMFVGAFWFAGIGFWMLRQKIRADNHFGTTASFRRLHPYLATILCGLVVSMFTLSRAYVEPVYLGLGVANAYFLDATRRGFGTPVRLSVRRCIELTAASIVFLLFIYLFIKVNTG